MFSRLLMFFSEYLAHTVSHWYLCLIEAAQGAKSFCPSCKAGFCLVSEKEGGRSGVQSQRLGISKLHTSKACFVVFDAYIPVCERMGLGCAFGYNLIMGTPAMGRIKVLFNLGALFSFGKLASA